VTCFKLETNRVFFLYACIWTFEWMIKFTTLSCNNIIYCMIMFFILNFILWSSFKYFILIQIIYVTNVVNKCVIRKMFQKYKNMIAVLHFDENINIIYVPLYINFSIIYDIMIIYFPPIYSCLYAIMYQNMWNVIMVKSKFWANKISKNIVKMNIIPCTVAVVIIIHSKWFFKIFYLLLYLNSK